MLRREVTIRNELGLHARAAARLVECANRFSSEVELTHGDRSVNGKSIMGVLMLAAGKGSVLVIETRGPDQYRAMEALCRQVEDGFGEA